MQRIVSSIDSDVGPRASVQSTTAFFVSIALTFHAHFYITCKQTKKKIPCNFSGFSLFNLASANNAKILKFCFFSVQLRLCSKKVKHLRGGQMAFTVFHSYQLKTNNDVKSNTANTYVAAVVLVLVLALVVRLR